jgi:PAS domain S-box-containing protein/putative nucleotidyltransferase with HDIG domain
MPRKPAIKTLKQLIAENADLWARLDEAEETLNAIRNGEVDAIIVSGAQGEQVFTLQQAEEALRMSEEKYRQLVEEINDGVYATDYEGVFTFANPAMARIYGVATPQALLGRKILDFIAPEMLKELGRSFRSKMQAGRAPEFINSQIVRPDGTRVFIEDKPSSKVIAGKVVGSQGVVRDITERKKTEEALRNHEELLQRIFDTLPVGLWIADKDGKLLRGNPAGVKIWGAEPKVGPLDYGVFKGRRLPSGEDVKADDWALAHTIRDKVTIVDELLEIDTFDGKKKTIINFTAPVLDAQGVIQGAIVVNQDITELKQGEERIRRQLEHLTALSGIDRVISANFDLKLSLSEILNHVTKELGVDAADILILNSGLQMLEYGAERGFRTKAIRNTYIRLGESYIDRAVLEHQLIQIPDLREEPKSLPLKNRLTGEDFICYYGVPLIIKGQVKGVMEIFHRATLEPDSEWFDFLNTLAGQAAIAVEIATLFESLQLSNSELFLAYDATIEGWSHALDLRDKETEGHTQRVTEMTVKLARTFGLSDAELVQVRWGALLHDIGKMGVPDGILLKPGLLTDKEWVSMKKHPGFAYDMLSPIHYLRNAIDIPYCHHEKWDGSGYPRGLKGTKIPLAARIFAVVDVWDALRSDRPYRPAWAADKVREHIRSSAGTHFDPQVVDVFMQMLD